MKPKHIVAMIILGAAIVVFIMGCFLFGISINDRISQFQGDLNKTDRTNIYKNFHPTATKDYNAIKTPTFFDTLFPTAGLPTTQYTLTSIDSSNPSHVTAAISGPVGSIWYPGPVNVYFVMEKDGNDWMIAQFYRSTTSGSTAIVQ